MKAIQIASNAREDSNYDFAHATAGIHIIYLNWQRIWRPEISKITNFPIMVRFAYVRLIETRAHLFMNFE